MGPRPSTALGWWNLPCLLPQSGLDLMSKCRPCPWVLPGLTCPLTCHLRPSPALSRTGSSLGPFALRQGGIGILGVLSGHFLDFRAPVATCLRHPHTLGSVTFPGGPSGLRSTSALTCPRDCVRVGQGPPQAHRMLVLLNPFPSLEECPPHVGQGRLAPRSPAPSHSGSPFVLPPRRGEQSQGQERLELGTFA